MGTDLMAVAVQEGPEEGFGPDLDALQDQKWAEQSLYDDMRDEEVEVTYYA